MPIGAFLKVIPRGKFKALKKSRVSRDFSQLSNTPVISSTPIVGSATNRPVCPVRAMGSCTKTCETESRVAILESTESPSPAGDMCETGFRPLKVVYIYSPHKQLLLNRQSSQGKYHLCNTKLSRCVVYALKVSHLSQGHLHIFLPTAPERASLSSQSEYPSCNTASKLSRCGIYPLKVSHTSLKVIYIYSLHLLLNMQRSQGK